MSRPANRQLIRPIFFSVAFLLLLTERPVAQPHVHDEQSPYVSLTRFDTEAMRSGMLLDGIAPGAVETLLLQHEALVDQGRNPVIFSRNTLPSSGNTVCMSCAGIGVENGWSNWQGYAGSNNNLGLTFALPGNPFTPRFEITAGAGIDPLTPGLNSTDPVIPVVAPGFGSHSIRLGEPNTPGYGAERLVFPLTVGPSDTSFIYTYAFVMENPSNIQPPHDDVNMPYVEFMILDLNGDTVDCAYRRYQANENFPGQYVCNSPVQSGSSIIPIYKPWTTVGVNLSAYIGQNLTVVITNADCQLGGHFAHSYWDFSCGSTPAMVRPNCQAGVPDTLVAPDSEVNNPYTYSWFRNHDPAPIGTTQVVTPITQPNDTFHVEITTAEGCTWYLFYIPQPFRIEASFLYTATCGNVAFTDSSYVPVGGESISTWNWRFDDGAIPGYAGTDPGVITFSSGSHQAELIVGTPSGCVDTAVMTIVVPEPPAADLNAPDVCLGAETILQNRTAGTIGDPVLSYEWYIPDGNPVAATTATARTVFSTPGTHQVQLIAVAQSGCRDTATGQAMVYRPPVPELNGSLEACVPFCTPFFENSSSQDGQLIRWDWTFQGGSPSVWQGRQPEQICYLSPGTYEVELTVRSEKGCVATTRIPAAVIAHEKPRADFSVEPMTSNNAQPVFDFKDVSSADVVRWDWDFGDGISVGNAGPLVTHSYEASVTENDFYRFETQLYVTNRFGCMDTINKPVTLEPVFSFFLPSAFTPDGNAVNGFFFGKGRGIRDYEFYVFDRWGLEVWSCRKSGDNTAYDQSGNGGLPAECQWDGYYNGDKVQQDVYVWLVRLEDVFGRRHTYTGRVSVIY